MVVGQTNFASYVCAILIFIFDRDENKHMREMRMQRTRHATHAIREYAKHDRIQHLHTVY